MGSPTTLVDPKTTTSTTKPWWQNADLLGGVIAPTVGTALQVAGSNAQANKNEKYNREQAALQALLLQQQREQQARAAAAGAHSDLFTQGLNDQFRRSGAYLDAAPAGWAQDLEVRNALSAALVPAFAQRANALRNLRSGDPGVAAMQAQLPEFNVDLSRFLQGTSRGATAASIGDRERGLQQLMQGSGPATSISSFLGGDPAALRQEKQSSLWANNLRQQAQEKEDLNRQYVLGALEGNLNQASDWRAQQEQAYQKAQQQQEKEKKKGGFWSKFGKILGSVAPIIAAPFTGGLSLAAQAAIGAGLGAAGGALSGGGLKGTLLGAAGGAIPGVGGAVTKNIASPTMRALARAGIGAAGNAALGGGLAGAATGAATGYMNSGNIDRTVAMDWARGMDRNTQTGLPPGIGTAVSSGGLPPPPQPGSLGFYPGGRVPTPNFGAGVDPRLQQQGRR